MSKYTRQQALGFLDELCAAKLAIMDTETTGFTGQCQIIELAALVPEELGSNNYATFQKLYKPTVKIGYGAKKTHGINLGMVINQPVLDTVEMDMFMDFLNEYDVDYLVGWNFAFDVRMFRQTLEAHTGDSMHPIMERLNTDAIDLMKLIVALHSDLGGKLSQAKAMLSYGVSAVGTSHRALGDCENLYQLMKAVIDKELNDG